MDMGFVRGLITFLVLVLFLGIWAWSWSRNRHTEFEAASQLPLGDDRQPPDQVFGSEELKEQQS